MDNNYPTIYCPPDCQCNICINVHSTKRWDKEINEQRKEISFIGPYTEDFA